MKWFISIFALTITASLCAMDDVQRGGNVRHVRSRRSEIQHERQRANSNAELLRNVVSNAHTAYSERRTFLKKAHLLSEAGLVTSFVGFMYGMYALHSNPSMEAATLTVLTLFALIANELQACSFSGEERKMRASQQLLRDAMKRDQTNIQ